MHFKISHVLISNRNPIIIELQSNNNNIAIIVVSANVGSIIVLSKALGIQQNFVGLVSYELCPNIAIVFKAMDGYDSLNLDSER
ncbi:hypothetical protein QR98_0017810 [Sarcoptes scabiei]|uniref:Uncharacterized protein n=1 Tax=Sarcoptes scabiei TaxID=52283 RepID=A0A131ZZ02_SARSC|nr:hypothetical protein QR98_0017810 [Sarcoptes scabiei]